MVTPKGSMSTERERDTPNFCPNLRGIGGPYVLPMPRDLPQLQRRILEAVAAIDRQMLRVWQELDYRIDICRVTKGGHMDHL
jgi:hypothetical protein